MFLLLIIFQLLLIKFIFIHYYNRFLHSLILKVINIFGSNSRFKTQQEYVGCT